MIFVSGCSGFGCGFYSTTTGESETRIINPFTRLVVKVGDTLAFNPGFHLETYYTDTSPRACYRGDREENPNISMEIEDDSLATFTVEYLDNTEIRLDRRFHIMGLTPGETVVKVAASRWNESTSGGFEVVDTFAVDLQILSE